MKYKADLALALCTLFLLGATIPIMGANNASDNAGIDQAWYGGGNGGNGFNSWTLINTTNVSWQNGCFTWHSLIDDGGWSWGLYANSGQTANAGRAFMGGSLLPGQQFSISMLNNAVDVGGTVGLSLEDNSHNKQLEIYYVGGRIDYTINVWDIYGSPHEYDTGVPFTTSGLNIVVTQLSNNQFLATITPLGGSATTIPGVLAGSGISSFRLFNNSSGFDSPHDFYFNDIAVTTLPPSPQSPGTSSDTGYTVGSMAPTFSWTGVGGASRYGFYISHYPYGAANIIYSNTAVTGTSFQIPGGYLQPNTKYRWNMTSFDDVGNEGNVSSRLYFQTSGSTVQTLPASSITANTAQLNGYINPNGLPIYAYYEYGTSSSYGTATPSGYYGVTAQNVGFNVTGLAADTTYHFRLVASINGSQIKGDDITFQTLGQTITPVSASLSTLTTTPSSVPADGQSHINAMVTLRNTSNAPVAGKSVRFYSSRGNGIDTISQSAAPTDANGQATVTITTTTPGTSIISVSDVSDSVVIGQHPQVTFTSDSVLPGNNLSNAIVSLSISTSNNLTNKFASIATEEGSIGNYFDQQMTGDEAEIAGSVFSGAIGILLPFVPGTIDALTEASKSLATDKVMNTIPEIVAIIAGNNTGLSKYANSICSLNSTYQKILLQKENKLLAGVPPNSTNYIADYLNDLTLRAQGNDALGEVLLAQDIFLRDIQQKSVVGQVDLLTPLFMSVNAAGAVVGTAFATPVGGYAIAEGLNAGELLLAAPLNQQQLKNDQQSYMTVFSSLTGCSYYSQLIFSNTLAGYNTISQGQRPKPITGKILSIDSQIAVKLPGTIYGSIVSWLGEVFENTTAVMITGEYSILTITNTSSQSAFYSVSASYSHTVNISLDTFGVTHYSMTIPMVVSATATIGANQTAQVEVYYGNQTNGALPDVGTPITINMLGYDNNQGIYYADFASTSLQMPTSVGNNVKMKATPSGVTPHGGLVSTNIFAFENPIKSFVYQNPSNQTYQAQIWVANPFAIPLLATVTQPLPPGMTILSTDGILNGSSIVWTNAIPTNGLIFESFAFALSAIPGAITNLPAPTVLFGDLTGTNSLSITGYAASFSGLLPVLVSGVVPSVVSDQSTPMLVTLTNLTGTNQAGTVNVSITDNMGIQITNLSAPFSEAGFGGTNLAIYLPGPPLSGTYFVTATLLLSDGSEQFLAKSYVVPAPQVVLGFGSIPALTVNGINLMLRGPINSNYLIEASSDLMNWTPIITFTTTNSPFNFSDPSATNSSARYYRAVIP